uniref:Uncharacterized protein n=1 Tax=Rhipicephalus zambeziensis TaxID=60191 RepID=A0A224YFX6_9ACAR
MSETLVASQLLCADREKKRKSLKDSLGNTAVDGGNDDSMFLLKDDDRCCFCPGLITIGPRSDFFFFTGCAPNFPKVTLYFSSLYQ